MAETPVDASGQRPATDRLTQAAASLPEPLRLPFRRLGRELLAQAGRGRWRLFICRYAHTAEREQVAQAIESLLPGSARVEADAALHPDWSALEAELARAASVVPGAALQVFGLEHWLDPLAREATAQRLRAANLRREAFARAAPAALVFWLREAQVRDWVAHAPDLWAWRSGVHEFVGAIEPAADAETGLPRSLFSPGEMDNRTAEQRQARIDALRSYLEATAQQPDSQLRLDLYDEWADLLHSLGDNTAALALRRDVLAPMCVRMKNEREIAVNQGKIADILQERGQLDEALGIRLAVELPIFERLRDERAVTVVRGRIADIYQARGQFDEALHIHSSLVLPVFEHLADEREVAVTYGRIADIFQARHQYDEALRIRREEELPVFERLGDVREVAVTQGKIADILQARGHLDQALHIRQEVQLPVFERLGDVRGIAATQFKIASSRLNRGDHATQAGFSSILESLLIAWKAVQRLQALDGITAVGNLLAEMLAKAGGFDQALQVLALVERSQAKLGDETGLQRTARLRQRVQSLASAVVGGGAAG